MKYTEKVFQVPPPKVTEAEWNRIFKRPKPSKQPKKLK
jgi:hypothetical protein